MYIQYKNIYRPTKFWWLTLKEKYHFEDIKVRQ
jgi:hypothetical protein